MLRRLPAPILAALAIVPALGAQQFTYNPTALPANSLWTDGVAIADVDGDADMDILFADGSNYATGTPAQQQLYLNDGSAIFSAAHSNLNVANLGARMVIAEDFDADGDVDLMYAPDSPFPNPTKKPVLLLNDGSGHFTDVSASNLPGLAMASFGVCAGDVDDDGDLDVVFTDGGTFGGTNAQAHLFLNDGSAVFSDATASKLPVDLFKQQDVILLDIDNDFDVDIAITGKGGATHVYLNDGTGQFTLSTMANAVGTTATYEIDWADLDLDGDFDAAVQSISGFTEGWARNDGTAVAMHETTFSGPSEDDNEMACFDYDVDGDMDVLVGSLGASERLYRNDGAANFTIANGVIQAIQDSTLDLAIGDLNADGRYDIVTGQGESGNFTNKVYMNNGPADTLAPAFMATETPPGIGATTTVFRAQVRDQFADDGHIPVRVTFSYTTDGSHSGSGAATPMGNGLFRAAVPSAGATSVSLTWTATDFSGNVSHAGPILLGGTAPWTSLGRALAGVSGTPSLVGSGTLVAGSAGSLVLANAAPAAACELFVALSSSPVPFKGGLLCASPPSATLALVTGPAGALSLPWASWPSGLSGFSLYFQHAISDVAAIHGVSLSNAVRGDVP